MANPSWTTQLATAVQTRLETAHSSALAKGFVHQTAVMVPTLTAMRGRNKLVLFTLGMQSQPKAMDGGAYLGYVNLTVGVFVSLVSDDPGKIKLVGNEFRELTSYVNTALHGWQPRSAQLGGIADYICSPFEIQSDTPPPQPYPVAGKEARTTWLWEVTWFQATIGLSLDQYTSREFFDGP